MQSLKEVLDLYNDTKNKTIINSIIKTWDVINNKGYNKILCSVSGGSDSDIMLDIIYKCDKDNKVKYVWFDTGLEYQATKNHLNYLEDKYNIKIERERVVKPIPLTCKEYGQPFLSKYVSRMINGLQKHNFRWEDKSYDELIREYPTAKSYISWWCNKRDTTKYGYSMFNINYNKHLKEFLMQNPPQFSISDKCCDYAKKAVGKECIKKYNIDLTIVGVRKSEGGVRAAAYKNCFSTGLEYDEYRPIFWYTLEDKSDYENNQQIKHSDCYTKYGFTRTGCACCPYGHLSGLNEELKVLKEYEPNLYTAVNNIFSDSYEYTKQYYDFRNHTNAELFKRTLNEAFSGYDIETFEQRLQYILARKGMTQIDLAKQVGCDRKTINRLINGTSKVNIDILKQICSILNVSADYLLFGILKGSRWDERSV